MFSPESIQFGTSSPIQAVANFSGGLGSWYAAKLAGRTYGLDNLTLLFADTLMESDGLYRFLPDATADVFGHPRVTPGVRDLIDATPPIRADMTEADWSARKDHLATVRATVMGWFFDRAARRSRLVWLADGRTPWEVFADESFLGNSRVDPCSKILKRQLLDQYIGKRFDQNNSVCVVGVGRWERHRFEGQWVNRRKNGEIVREWKPGLRDRMKAKGWTFVAPLIDHNPAIDRYDLPRLADEAGLEVSSAYDDGFSHDNCGGECVKGGQSHWAMMYRLRRDRFDHAERRENELRARLGNVSMMADRRGGAGKRPLPLAEFRQRLEAGEPCETTGGAPCACFFSDE